MLFFGEAFVELGGEGVFGDCCVVAARREGKAVKAAVAPRVRRISRRLRNGLSKGARRLFMGAVSQRGRGKARRNWRRRCGIA